jgi:hypothetical protein
MRRHQRLALDRSLPNQLVFREDDPALLTGTRQPLFVRSVLREHRIVRDRSDTMRAAASFRPRERSTKNVGSSGFVPEGFFDFFRRAIVILG